MHDHAQRIGNACGLTLLATSAIVEWLSTWTIQNVTGWCCVLGLCLNFVVSIPKILESARLVGTLAAAVGRRVMRHRTQR